MESKVFKSTFLFNANQLSYNVSVFFIVTTYNSFKDKYTIKNLDKKLKWYILDKASPTCLSSSTFCYEKITYNPNYTRNTVLFNVFP